MAESVKEYLARIGRKGGKASRRRLTVEERIDAARHAAQARWAKQKKQIESSLQEIRGGTEALLSAEAARTDKAKKKQRAAEKS